MTLVLPINPEEYLHIPDTEDYITQYGIFFSESIHSQNELIHGNNALILSPMDSLILDKILVKGILEEMEVRDGAENIMPQRG